MTDDTLPPADPSNDTLPPTDAETDAEIVVPALDAVPKGWARFELQRAVTHAERSIDKLATDLRAIVALADSFARVLDAGTE